MKIQKITTCSVLSLILGLYACTQKTGPGNIELASGEPALKTMERVALTANRCWFKSDKAEFKRYGFEPELQSYPGRRYWWLKPKAIQQKFRFTVRSWQRHKATQSARMSIVGSKATTSADNNPLFQIEFEVV